MPDATAAELAAETDELMRIIAGAAAEPDSHMWHLAQATADTIGDEFTGTPGLGPIIAGSFAAASAMWHAVNPGHDQADPRQVIAILGHAAVELHRREQSATTRSLATEPGPTGTTEGERMPKAARRP
jgi:hypothetical protein